MRRAVLCRTETSEQGTFGILLTDGFQCFTGELPWKENRPAISCIPAGEYLVQTRTSPKYGTIYHVKEVDGRSWILIHWGNLVGGEGYQTHSQGCILLGSKLGHLRNQRAVLNSRLTVTRFMNHMDRRPFMLTIIDPFHRETEVQPWN